MSCNGCRILRKGCSERCVLRPCLVWIHSPDAQAYATLFLAKFYGRSDLFSFISAVPDHRKSAVFQSLLMEACGRTVNPVNGAVGLLCSGNWHICQSAVNAVLSGGTLCPMTMNSAGKFTPIDDCSKENSQAQWEAGESRSKFESRDEIGLPLRPRFSKKILTEKSGGRKRMMDSFSSSVEKSSTITSFEKKDENEKKLLKLFV